MKKFVNIGRNSLRRRNFGVMAGKVLVRLKERDAQSQKAENLAWCRAHAQSCEAFARELDAALWKETEDACTAIARAAQEKLDRLGLDLGGGGDYRLLYFLTRFTKAHYVVETGVAAGWSSRAILSALEKNGAGGKLFSSDFPYFRYDNPEKLVGYVVDDDLKKNWSLYIDGDRNNLPLIMVALPRIDLFHYDSDKSRDGRDYALKTLRPKLTERAPVLFDDIQDNSHFRDLVESEHAPFRIFEFGGKYIGLTGGFLKQKTL